LTVELELDLGGIDMAAANAAAPSSAIDLALR
jgi:hypothetical protein